ncbi:hypothetical protein COU19_03265 [Candidatus Kaiserbacteria bacterium CG10_big_fil_rev_8_21_14_0_10_56_12]|uniref:Cation-transporting P-type ATPase N-terminal domain-containing protein n=1 Tax=Candidatus Kaiserbacteria bacterium CG10_big_fil_rev_8_21_14_0_10_56_12 TaxID=1974611 RepID=A0A2H0U937_9BACT|nr:MAG: hypothetical protein COU19_03265 [Candidatus Kaiserbacteria bacterium CG10_big_fil_rev_8_21_14_0_10_56_12]
MPHGLSSAEAKRLLAQYGPNEIAEKKQSVIVRFVRAFASPASVMLIAASAISYDIGRQFDGSFIPALLLLNVGMSLWHGHKAESALRALRAQLSVTARALRDGVWATVPARELVVGDVIRCGVGVLVPADVRIDTAVNLSLNEAVLTGESLHKAKKEGDTAYSGSAVATGECTGTVTATGNQAFFGKIASAGAGKKRTSSMEKDILSISRFLIIASLVAVALLSAVFLSSGQPLADVAILDLSLLIAGIPVSLPTVMTLIVSIGALAVAAKKALVRRLSALEDFANVTLLLTDKTGTLTENKISVERGRMRTCRIQSKSYDAMRRRRRAQTTGAPSIEPSPPRPAMLLYSRRSYETPSPPIRCANTDQRFSQRETIHCSSRLVRRQ